jgi:biopolymer transport protein ExbB/TolQ
MDRRLQLAVVLAPLVGSLGTVIGLLVSLPSIGDGPTASAITKGIAVASLTTLVGLIGIIAILKAGVRS